jgi:hypothetical protein
MGQNAYSESGIQSKFRIGEDIYLAATTQNPAPSQNHKSEASSIIVSCYFIAMLEKKRLQNHCL